MVTVHKFKGSTFRVKDKEGIEDPEVLFKNAHFPK